jgi:hypothetical protein
VPTRAAEPHHDARLQAAFSRGGFVDGMDPSNHKSDIPVKELCAYRGIDLSNVMRHLRLVLY